MTDRRRRLASLALALAALTVVAACTASSGGTSGASQQPAAASIPPTPARAASQTPGRTASPTPAASAAAVTPGSSPVAAATAPGVVLTQAWATAPLVDVSTGETFRIADYAGKVVILETMAIWCSSCRAQQGDVQAALARLPADKVVFVVLDTDKSENAASLAAYRTKNGFEGRYAIAGNEVARALAADFGDQFLNPPVTPMLVIGTDGTVTRTDFGHKSTDQIVALAEANGA
jgi:thiol-disulfide isomerase/thioredoxin